MCVGSVSGEGRGSTSGARGRSTRRSRGGSGRGVGASASDRLTDRQREILVNGWKQQENVFTRYPFQGATPGPTTPSSGESASACFNRFFTDEVWDLLVEETNRFAAQVRATLTSPSSRPWHDVDREEMKAFVGM